MKHIVFLLHSLNAASSQRRVLDYEKFLREAGIEPRWVSYAAPAPYERWAAGSVKSENPITSLWHRLAHLGFGGMVLLSRWWTLVRLLPLARHADGVYIQKSPLPTWYVRLLSRINPRIAFDFDDAIFLRRPKITAESVAASRVVAAGSHYIFEYANDMNPSTVLLPTPVDAGRFSVSHELRSGDKIVIGWIGSVTTIPQLDRVHKALDRIAERYPQVILRVIGCGNRRDLIPTFKHMPCEIIPRIPYEEVPKAVAAFDIGIMPLLDGEWEKGKCVGKALEYMAAGIPAVVSRFGENIWAIEDGVNGFLAAHQDEWVDKLVQLIESPELSRQLGLAGRQTIDERYSTRVCSRILIEEVLSQIDNHDTTVS